MAESEPIEALCKLTEAYEEWLFELHHGVPEEDGEEIGGVWKRRLMEWASGQEGYAFWVQHHYGEEEVPA